MSEPHLPEDLDRWPGNPYEILGVLQGVSERDLRRAYTRLIRVFKPEQFPEHFRRIREAYDALLPTVNRPSVPEKSPPPRPDPSTKPGTTPPPSRRGTDALPLAKPVGPNRSPCVTRLSKNDLDEAWQHAIRGEESVSYQRLLQLHQQSPHSADVFLRLYWLLSVSPHLDEYRRPCDWLVQGLLASGLTGPLRGLYHDEVRENPTEAWSNRFQRLLACDVRPGLVADLVEWRWRAGVLLKRWDLLTADVVSLRPRILQADEETWLRLLFVLADEVGWQTDDAAVDLFVGCRKEIERFEHWTHRYPVDFYRLDTLVALVKECRSIEGWRTLYRKVKIPPSFPRLISLSWNRPFPEIRPFLQEVQELICQDPLLWLGYFDAMQKKVTLVLSQFGQILDKLQAAQEGNSGDANAPDVVRKLARDFLDTRGTSNYNMFRTKFLEFCLREIIAPESVAALAENRPADWDDRETTLAQAILEDWPLRYVYKAYRLFWE